MLKLMGLASTLSSLDAYGAATGRKVFKAVDEKAEDVKADMSGMAARRTGAMGGGVDIAPIEKSRTIYLVAVGPPDDLKSGVPDKPYSIFVEYGGAHGAAQPFIRPAAEMNKPFRIKF